MAPETKDGQEPTAFQAWFWQRLRRREWNRTDFARASGWPDGGVDPAMVAKWAAGIRTPAPESCERIADVFGVDLDEVLAVAGHRPRAEPDDPRVAEVAARLRRVDLTDERYELLVQMLDVMRRVDAGGRG